jgi:molybdenum cofactor cytidylyltransferase
VPLSESIGTGAHDTARVVGVLLAAGAGRRYGKPKVLVDGWLDTAVAALRNGGCADVVVVLGAAEVAVPPGVVAVVAPDWREGLSASVRAGLAQAERMRADYAALHVIDTPDVGPAVVARVVRRGGAAGRGQARPP